MYGQDHVGMVFLFTASTCTASTAQDAALLKAKQNLIEGPVSVELLFQAQ